MQLIPWKNQGLTRQQWFNDRWRNLRGYTSRGGTWKWVGAPVLLCGIGAASIVGGVGNHTDSPAQSRASGPHLSDVSPDDGFSALTIPTTPPTTMAAPPTTRPRASRSAPARYGSGACGGSLPPCCVLAGESGGNLTAHNPSGADGKWQFMPRTWNSQDGNMKNGGYQADNGTVYPTPSSAPESVQDEAARKLYGGGAGRGHWSAKC